MYEYVNKYTGQYNKQFYTSDIINQNACNSLTCVLISTAMNSETYITVKISDLTDVCC
jgi:hypothetical protein